MREYIMLRVIVWSCVAIIGVCLFYPYIDKYKPKTYPYIIEIDSCGIHVYNNGRYINTSSENDPIDSIIDRDNR